MTNNILLGTLPSSISGSKAGYELCSIYVVGLLYLDILLLVGCRAKNDICDLFFQEFLKHMPSESEKGSLTVYSFNFLKNFPNEIQVSGHYGETINFATVMAFKPMQRLDYF